MKNNVKLVVSIIYWGVMLLSNCQDSFVEDEIITEIAKEDFINNEGVLFIEISSTEITASRFKGL
jgi:hypothetical protein